MTVHHGDRTGDPVRTAALHRRADGRPWSLPTRAGTHLYLLDGNIAHLKRALGAEVAPGEELAPADLALRVTTALEGAIADLVLVTREGVLTALTAGRPKPPSVDYLCRGPHARRWFGADLVSMVVRLRPPDTDTDPAGELVTDDGLLHLLVTVTPRSPRWHDVLRGEPVGPDAVTHVLGQGERFDPRRHCSYVSPTAG